MKKFTPILPVFLLAFLISPAFGATVDPFGDIGAGNDPFGDIGAGEPYTIIQLVKKKSGKSLKEKKKSGKSLKEKKKSKKTLKELHDSSWGGLLGQIMEGGSINLTASEPFMTSAVPIIANPIPAAAWLFGSALLGFITLSKRKKLKA